MKPLRLLVLLSSCVFALTLVTWSIIDGVARMRSAAAMAEAANKFLASLTPEQKAKATLDFADENRRDWTIVPRDRKGVPLKDLDENQRRLAMEFMKTGLGASGYQKATTIMSLEPVLAQLEGPNRRFPRDPELYYFSIFGTPSPKAAWGWRVEGHHISIHFTIVKGEMLSNTPLAFGSNPAEVREGERKGLRALAGEEDRGRDLIQALDEKQRSVAIFDQKAPSDILTLAKIKADLLKPEGIPAGQMNKQQKALLEKLIDEYLARMPQEVAAERSKKMRAAGIDKIHFAWAGGVNKGDPHYYRVQSPTFLIEYDNTQNNANHIHSVWRDFNGDFGEDLLREHYQTTPHGATQQNSPQQKSELRPAQQPPQEATQVLNPNAPAIANPEDLTIRDSVTVTDKDPGVMPKILYREKAKYTEAALDAGIQGIVVLNMVLGADGKLRDIKVVQGLPFGLTQKAIIAAKKIRFRPAEKDGKPVDFRASLEFTFEVYDDVRSMASGILQAGVGGVTKLELTEVKKPEYTEAARKNGVEGKVRLFVVFHSNGRIGEIEVIEGLPDGLTDKAIDVAKALKFKPATYSTKAVNVWSEIAITFKLDQQ
jgi:TonB family protein